MSENVIISNNGNKWEYVIGLEVHAQVSSKSKLFSSASTTYGAEPNTQVSFIDAGFPGMLPTLNGYCIEQAIKTGLALNGEINKVSIFDRKNYFYPDLPAGYQISQFYHPIVKNGKLNITIQNGHIKTILINRIHLEQDAGKSLHEYSPNYSLIDLNRAGTALMEIVTDPVLSSPFEASEYIKKLRSILRCIGSCDGDMEKGSLRCDANVSVRKIGDSKLGTRCELKNLNSTKNLMKAIEYEAHRQIAILETGGSVLQETRLFDTDTNQTKSMREKTDAADYRYFPEPDLLPVVISEELINNIASNLPELPDAKIDRYTMLRINRYDAEVIVEDDQAISYFEEAIKNANAKLVANWLISELFGLLNKHNIDLNNCKIQPQQLAELINLIESKVISGKIAKEIFQIMFNTGESPEKIVNEKGLSQISDSDQLEKIINDILSRNKESVIDYRNGKDKLFGFFVGQVMKATQGKANPNLVNELLKDRLDKFNVS